MTGLTGLTALSIGAAPVPSLAGHRAHSCVLVINLRQQEAHRQFHMKLCQTTFFIIISFKLEAIHEVIHVLTLEG